MPLRLLLYAALYRGRERRDWEAWYPAGDSLKLNPIVPSVFHSMPRPWTARSRRRRGRSRQMMAEALRRSERVSDTEHVRWHELVQCAIGWAVRRRSSAERDGLAAVAQASQAMVQDRQEIAAMTVRLWNEETGAHAGCPGPGASGR